MMTESTDDPNDQWLDKGDPAETRSNQFSLGTILWSTLAVGLFLGYASWLGPKEVTHAVIFATIGSGVGVVLGLVNRRFLDTLFWSLFVTMLAFLAVAGGRLTAEAVFYGWGVVGAFSGGLSACEKPRAYWARTLFMGSVSGLAMYVMIKQLHGDLTGLLWFDVASAFVVGAILAPFIGFLNWFEKESRQPRILLAAWLTICVLIGNMLVPVLTGVSR
jgi:hypothetical protein